MRLDHAVALGFTIFLLGSPLAAEPVAIQHTPPDCVVANAFPRIVARLSPSTGVAAARVYFRSDDSETWCSADMKSDAPSFAAVLPRAQGDRLHYYIQVVDKGAAEIRSEPFAARVVADSAACGGGSVAPQAVKVSVPACDSAKPQSKAKSRPAPTLEVSSPPPGPRQPEQKPRVTAAAERTDAAAARRTPSAPAPKPAKPAATAPPPKPAATAHAAVTTPVPAQAASSRDRPVTIGLVDPACVLSNGLPRLGASLSPTDQVKSARIYFRRDEASDWCHVEMMRSGPGYAGVLPRDANSAGLQYYIWAADRAQKETRTAHFSAPGLGACEGNRADDALLQPAIIPVMCGEDPAGGGGRKAAVLLAGLGALGGGALAAKGAASKPPDTASDPSSTYSDNGRGTAASPGSTPTPTSMPASMPTAATPPPPGGCTDSLAPSTAITSPRDGQTISFVPTTVTASASDNVGVTRVEFFARPVILGVSGVLQAIGAATSSPYDVSWTPSCVATYRLYSVASDACGNRSTSAEIEVFLEVGIAPPCAVDGSAPTPTLPPEPTSTPQPTAPPVLPTPTPGPTPTPVIPLPFPLAGDASSDTAVVWASELTAPGASGQVLLNGTLTASVVVGRVQQRSAARKDENRFDGMLMTPSGQPGFWRFELQGRRVTSVLAGDVVRQDAESIVFRIYGRGGERVAFAFR